MLSRYSFAFIPCILRVFTILFRAFVFILSVWPSPSCPSIARRRPFHSRVGHIQVRTHWRDIRKHKRCPAGVVDSAEYGLGVASGAVEFNDGADMHIRIRMTSKRSSRLGMRDGKAARAR
ncbi:hypothetical protein C8R44DRAFT_74605 [Mycena epipterygia]|nr:hypothetical protein C8R44DRAFT_74605 [Mycena epipterygia]